MALLTPAAFLSKWQGRFPTTGNREISAADMREFVEDLKDSFQNILSATTITSWKEPVIAATTGNITLSGEQTIDGVLTSNDRVLVRAQTDASENGIYVSAAGAWSRATDADSAAELEGAAVGVQQGSTYADAVFLQTTDSITLGTSDIEWQQIGFGSATPSLAEVLGVANDADGNAIENLADPTNDQDAATKAYVDSLLTITSVDTSGATVTLDFGGKADMAFKGSVNISGNKAVVISNDTNAKQVRYFKFQASAGITLTFESDVRHGLWDGAWDSETGLVWTSPADGVYIMKASRADSLWFVEISGPYPTT